MSNVVLLRDSPPLTDIPAMLRRVADQIESGEINEVDSAYLVLPGSGFPRLYGWGDIEGDNAPIIQLEMAKHWLVANMVSR